MKNFYSIILCISLIFPFYAQVGIGTTTPSGAFDVTSTNDGLLIPRIALTNTTTSTIITPTKSELVYNTATTGDVTPGYYYWETTPTVASDRWVRLITSLNTSNWSTTGNTGTNPATNFIGTTDPQDLRFRTNSTNKINIEDATGQFQTYTDGTQTAPAFSWNTDTNTGIYRPANDNLAFSTNGAQRIIINDIGNIGVNLAPQTFARIFSYETTAGKYAVDGYSDIAGGRGVRGRSIGAGSYGVFGTNDDTGNGAYGLNSGSGLGVLGLNSGTGSGIQGQTSSGTARGVIGLNLSATTGTGVLGQSNGASGTGVLGLTTANATGTTSPIAVRGSGNGTGSIGVYGNTNGDASTASAYGVFGIVNNALAGGNLKAAGNVGLNFNIINGNGYDSPLTTSATNAVTGISGITASKNTSNPTTGGAPQVYYFGVLGETLIDSGVAGAQIQRRSGGTIGIGVSGVFGILGYKNSANTNVGVYSTSALATGTGRMSSGNGTPNAGIGLGAIGGVIGGYVKGAQYGFISKGDSFGAYIMGNTITNKPITQIESIDNIKVISYATTSTTVDITSRGNGQLLNGKGYVAFDKTFTQLADLSDENLNITITAKGNTNGIYIENITRDGFYVKENMDGNHSVSFNWTAISIRKGYKDGIEVSKEILDPNWEKNMDGVMHNENDTTSEATPIHFNGSEVKFESLPKQYEPEHKKTNIIKTQNPKAAEAVKTDDVKEDKVVKEDKNNPTEKKE